MKSEFVPFPLPGNNNANKSNEKAGGIGNAASLVSTEDSNNTPEEKNLIELQAEIRAEVFQDAFEQGRQEGYDKGKSDGLQEAAENEQQKMSANQDALLSVLTKIASKDHYFHPDFVTNIAQCVEILVQRITTRSFQEQPELIAECVKNVLLDLNHSTQVVVECSQHDIEFLPQRDGIKLTADENLQQGEFKVYHGHTVIDSTFKAKVTDAVNNIFKG